MQDSLSDPKLMLYIAGISLIWDGDMFMIIPIHSVHELSYKHFAVRNRVTNNSIIDLNLLQIFCSCAVQPQYSVFIYQRG